MSKLPQIVLRLPRKPSAFGGVVKPRDGLAESVNKTAKVFLYKRNSAVNGIVNKEHGQLDKSAEQEQKKSIYSGTESTKEAILSARRLQRLGDPRVIHFSAEFNWVLTKLVQITSKVLSDCLAECKHVEAISPKEVRTLDKSVAQLKDSYKAVLAATVKQKAVLKYSKLYEVHRSFLSAESFSFFIAKCAYLIKQNKKAILEDAELDAKLDVATPSLLSAWISQKKEELNQLKDESLVLSYINDHVERERTLEVKTQLNVLDNVSVRSEANGLNQEGIAIPWVRRTVKNQKPLWKV